MIGLLLRDVRDEDLPVLFEHQWDPEVERMTLLPRRDREAFMLHWRNKVLGDPSGMKKAIVVDDVLVGNIVSWGSASQRLVGYVLGPAHWGRGIATAALSAFLREETIRPLHAHVAVQNRASIRVLEKCGFQREGAPESAPDGVAEYFFQLPA